MNHLKIKYCWIFLTEKCNLICPNCFYKFKKNRRIKFNTIKKIIKSDKIDKDTEFVISGGEPLIEFDYLKKVIKFIKKKYPNNYLLLQTNLILLRKEHIHFLKENNINIEIGLDGEYKSNIINRKKSNLKKFKKIINNIYLLKKNNIKISCTMTVTKSTVKEMIKNFNFLKKIRLKKIEITPAIYDLWDKKTINLFKKNYLIIIKKNSNIIEKGYDLIIKNDSIDFIVCYNNIILPNWCFLSLNDNLKKKNNIFNNNFRLNVKLIKKIQKIQGNNNCYREKSTNLSEYVYDELKINKIYFENYKEINNFLIRINKKFI